MNGAAVWTGCLGKCHGIRPTEAAPDYFLALPEVESGFRGIMLELTIDNLLSYMLERGWVAGPAEVTILAGGVSNVVFRVRADSGEMVVKQSRPQLRTREAWFSDLSRIHREQEVMQALAPLLPDVVPAVLHVDRDNYTFAMRAVPETAPTWKALLLAGVVDSLLGEHVGKVLGRMHQGSVEHAEAFQSFADATVFMQLRIEPFYYRVQQRRPEVAERLQDLVDQLLSRREALCHGDYTPKNLLIHGTAFTLVDYETAYLGDPALDLGLLFCHLLLKTVKVREKRRELGELIRSVWHGYAAAVRFRPASELQTRGVAHCGACLLARVDGTSPVDYLDDAQREIVRQLARRILLDRIADWETVLPLLDE